MPSYTRPGEKRDFYRMFNARSETVAVKSVFKRLLASHRCSQLGRLLSDRLSCVQSMARRMRLRLHESLPLCPAPNPILRPVHLVEVADATACVCPPRPAPQVLRAAQRLLRVARPGKGARSGGLVVTHNASCGTTNGSKLNATAARSIMHDACQPGPAGPPRRPLWAPLLPPQGGRSKQPYYVYLDKQPFMTMAGLYDVWRGRLLLLLLLSAVQRRGQCAWEPSGMGPNRPGYTWTWRKCSYPLLGNPNGLCRQHHEHTPLSRPQACVARLTCFCALYYMNCGSC